METIITCDSIMEYFQEKTEKHMPIGANEWIEGAAKLNVLLGTEQELLFSMQQGVAKDRVELLSQKPTPSVAMVKIIVESSDEYRDMQNQKAKIDRIIEHIRIAKIQSRNSADEARGLY